MHFAVQACGMSVDTVPRDYRDSIVPILQYGYQTELWAGDVAGFWMHRVPLHRDLEGLRFKLGKMSYDEVRHAEILRRMIQRFGGDDAVQSLNARLDESDRTDTWLYKMDYAFTEGPDDFIEFLPTMPLLADATGNHVMADHAKCSPDPVWSDAAESISVDERLHGSISSEFIPVVIDLYGDGAKRKLQRGLDRFMPVLFSWIGHPTFGLRDEWIENGVVSMDGEDVYAVMYDNLHEIFDDYPEIDVPDITRDDCVHPTEVPDFAVRVADGEV